MLSRHAGAPHAPGSPVARRVAACATAAALLAAGACGREEEPKRPLVDGRTVDGSLEVVVAGDHSFRYDQTSPLRIVVGSAPGIPAELRLLSVGLLQPRALPDGRGFRLAVDVLGYEGDGTYRLGEKRSGGERGTTAIEDKVFVDIYTPAGARTPIRFDRIGTPCTLTVRARGGAGRLRCPALSDASGASVSLAVTWDTKGE